MINIGEVLSQAEDGMQRYNAGSFTCRTFTPDDITVVWKPSSTYIYIAGNSSTPITGSTLEFDFVGKKIYLLGSASTSTGRAQNIQISVDEKIIGSDYTLKTAAGSSNTVFFAYECDNFEEHKIKIEILDSGTTGYNFYLNDVDTDGYVKYSTGDKLVNPMLGWKRYDGSLSTFKYDGFSYMTVSSSTNYLGSGYNYAATANSTLEFQFYGTSLAILSIGSSYKDNDSIIEIDGNIRENLILKRTSSSSIGYHLSYITYGLEEAIHSVKITSSTATTEQKAFTFDGIDIDGYLIEDGLYNVTPIDNYTITASSEFSEEYKGSNVFNNMNYYATHAWRTVTSDLNPYLIIDCGKKIPISKIRVIRSTTPSKGPQHVTIHGSNDGINYKQLSGPEPIGSSTEKFSYEDVNIKANCRYYKLDFIASSYIYIGEIMLLNDNIHLRYLIKDGDKIKTINDSNELIELDIEPNRDNFLNHGFADISELNNHLNNLSKQFKILSNTQNNISVKSLKSNLEMVVANNSFYTRLAQNIDHFKLFNNVSENTSIKVAISINDGATWLTYEDNKWKDLNITIPQKDYADLSNDELIDWNDSKNEIHKYGINAEALSSLDFNKLDCKKIRFAYVLNQNSAYDICRNTKLEWQFDAKGKMRKMGMDEYICDVFDEGVEIVPKIENEMIKVNITYDSNDQKSDSDVNINITDDEINKLIEEGWN